MAGRDGWEGVSVRWYRRCLRLLPRSFRREAGPEMEAVFRDGRRSARRRGLRVYVLFAISVLVDLCITVVAEWWRVLVGRIRRNASRPAARLELGSTERYREEGMAARGLRQIGRAYV